jgi:hypothetical protein
LLLQADAASSPTLSLFSTLILGYVHQPSNGAHSSSSSSSSSSNSNNSNSNSDYGGSSYPFQYSFGKRLGNNAADALRVVTPTSLMDEELVPSPFPPAKRPNSYYSPPDDLETEIKSFRTIPIPMDISPKDLESSGHILDDPMDYEPLDFTNTSNCFLHHLNNYSS